MTRWTKIALGAFAVFVVASVALYMGLLRLDVRPRLSLAPGYSLTGAGGDRLTSEDLRGTITVYTFDHLANDDPARRTTPLMQKVQAAVEESFAPDAPIRLVTVAFDGPTPKQLARAAADARADSSRWKWATGSQSALRTAVRDGFGVYYERKAGGGYRFDPTYVVVDGLGIVRARYRVGRPRAEWIIGDLRSVLREARTTSGPTSVAYQTAHLFSCYSVR